MNFKVKLYKEQIDNKIKEINSMICEGTNNPIYFGYNIIEDDVSGRVVNVYNIITLGKTENEILADLVWFGKMLLNDNIINNKDIPINNENK